MNFILLFVLMIGVLVFNSVGPIVIIPVFGGLLIIKIIIDVILGIIDGIFR